eukprot:TRINITY_DN1759_c0_g1_i1.p1 TRINITY_DN1759_c0_g1~~TRINITY_DN1759_c0_g1_i1.p1  ORF type:complete len:207 (-),score=45.52 TRINITY_DN1759_c0_g1_i1:304-924(-)
MNYLKLDGRLGWHTIFSWQTYLSESGINSGPIDGVFGPTTIAAVQIWLNKQNLPKSDLEKATEELSTLKAENKMLKITNAWLAGELLASKTQLHAMEVQLADATAKLQQAEQEILTVKEQLNQAEAERQRLEKLLREDNNHPNGPTRKILLRLISKISDLKSRLCKSQSEREKAKQEKEKAQKLKRKWKKKCRKEHHTTVNHQKAN